jgi:hypothetical protein
MKELNTLVYETIRDNSTFQSYTGATSPDPRIYYARTPVKHTVNSSKYSYAVFYLSGTTDPGNRVWNAGRNDHTYIVEVYSKKPDVLSTLLETLEALFRDANFETTSFIVGHTTSYTTAESFDETRQMYFGTIMIVMTNILEKQPSS